MQKFQNGGTAIIVLAIIFGVVSGSPTPEGSQDLDKKSYRNFKVLRTQPVHDVDVIKKLMMFDGLDGKLIGKS